MPSTGEVAPRSRTAFCWLLVIGTLLTACSGDGRDLAEAQDWQTTTTRPPPPTSALSSEVSTSGVELSSPEFEPGAPAPADVTCAGANRSPALEWTPVSPDIGELAIALIDQTEPESPLLLWLVTGIEPEVSSLAPGDVPEPAVETLNDYGQPGWGNPCLESANNGLRDLQFRLYLLDTPAGIQALAPGNEAWDIVVASAVDSASLLMRIEGSV